METLDEMIESLRRLERHCAGRQMTDSERTDWNQKNEKIVELQKRHSRIRELARNPQNVEVEVDRTVQPSRPRHDAPPHLTSTRDAALRALDNVYGELSVRAADRMESLIGEDVNGDAGGAMARYFAAAADENYRSAFGKLLADPVSAHLRWDPREHEAVQRVNKVMNEQRAIGIGSQGGNYPVPIVLDPTVTLNTDGQINPVRDLADVQTVLGNTWEGVASAGVTASYSAEMTEASDNSPTLTQPTANLEKAQVFVPFSIELGQDWASLQGEMAKLIADSKDVLESTKFLTGLGHGNHEPQGLIAPGGATSVVSTATTAVFAVADVYSLAASLGERWQPRASIVASRTTYNSIRQASIYGGSDLWVQLGNGLPSRLLDYNSRVWSTMSGGTATSGSTIMTIGDFSQYKVLDRVGLTVEVVPHVFGTINNYPLGARGFYAYWRNSTVVTSSGAFKSLKVK